MRALRRAIIAVLPMFGSALHASNAQRVGQASQVVTFRVIAVNQVAVSSAALSPERVAAGSAGGIAGRSSARGTYGMATNESGKKIVLSLDADLPPDVSVSMALTAPPGAASSGPIQLTSRGSDAVTDVPASMQTGLPISYALTGAANAIEPSLAGRTIWMTIISGT
jgi:hypothetical protein